MAKKIIFLAIISLLLFWSLSDFVLAEDRPLEIIYPEFPGMEPAPTVVATGLPEYVKYIFQLSIIIIGFIIFAALMKSGIQYLVSTGDPVKMADSREGIFSALLGVIILLSAFIIFNSINPQLTILKLPEVGLLEGVVASGVYICNYKVDNIGDILNKYLTAEGNEQIEATKELRKIMANPEKNQSCPRVNFSGNFDNFVVKKDGNDNTIFIIPRLKYVYNASANENEKKAIYEYGIVLHEQDDFGGQCAYYPKPDSNNSIFTKKDEIHQIAEYKAKDLKFIARSVTVFKKPITEPSSDAGGVILYSCFDYNRTGMCPVKTATGYKVSEVPFNPGVGNDVWEYPKETNLLGMANQVYSVKIDPKDSFFALLYENEDFGGKCGVIKSNDPNITDLPIGRCGAGCTWYGTLFFGWLNPFGSADCSPCLSSMILIKGAAL